MQHGIIKQFQEANALIKALVLFWPLWFVCAAALAISMEMTAWEPPIAVVGLLVVAPVVMLGIVWWAATRDADQLDQCSGS